ncbi:RNA recognition motif domain-containing protein [Enterovibrio nigricans]|uniref:RNA recognition motif. (A.k.a. RRM, RBD, or RNP domain) n=1 Tax=Enterovibrio nigricans DSM 22720 TaxID=1121868 RepID=A0A1T4UA80_9GAMM|nr:RNA-binding protein [Enterovibrio nigricans]PKF51412.1 RNA-binding protein [Enterovibrio nigricans]SKA49603.1 RNA recognition motif. (a.k.a. RRM, RBD, or RNP domain) [Enterovibrio nigricans DSM 22720]
MRISISLLITAAIAFVGTILFNSSQMISSTGYAFALGAVTVGIALSFLSTKSPSDISESIATNSKTIYVGNLPYRANENDVKDLFAEYGEVFAVRLMKDKRTGKRRGFGFVVMAAADTPEAIEKLNNSEYGERTLKVREANDPRKSERA